MRLSFLAVASLFFFSPLLLAQHRTESTSSDSHSSSSPSSSSSSSSSNSSSPSYSGGSSSSSSSSSSSHSSGASSDSSSHSSSSHSSGSSASDTTRGSTVRDTGDSRSSHTGGQPAPRDRNIRDNDTRRESGRSNVSATGTSLPPSGTRPVRADNERTIRDTKHDRGSVATDRQPKSEAKPEKEKRNFFLFWRHPKTNPDSSLKAKTQPPKRCKAGENCQTDPDLRAKIQPPKRCKVGEVCPPPCPEGSYRSEKGCVASQPPVTETSCGANEYWNGSSCMTRACPAGEYWDGVRCVSNVDSCAGVTGRGAMLVNELRGISARLQTACTQAPTGKECLELKGQHDGALLRYRMLLNGAPANCRTMLPDPTSL